jgi:hypothetical protein
MLQDGLPLSLTLQIDVSDAICHIRNTPILGYPAFAPPTFELNCSLMLFVNVQLQLSCQLSSKHSVQPY